jgi:plastocyanin
VIARKRLLAAVTIVFLVGTTNAFAAVDVTSVNIVDAPRPQPKWGYAPAARSVPPGTWVTWSNNGQDAHTVTAVDGSFDSGNLDPSEGFSWFFDQAGTFQYICALHPWMTGKIIVGDAVTAPTDTGGDAPPDNVIP